jgi:hypothetical protein
MDDLAILEAEERSATALLRDAQERKRALLQASADAEAALAANEYQAYLDRVKRSAPSELQVLGVSHSKLQGMLKRHYVLRLVNVHPDVLALLRAALVSRDEEHFVRLVSALVERLVGTHTTLRDVVETLKDAPASSHYFCVRTDEVSIPIVAVGRVAGVPAGMLSDLVTAWALSWGEASKYES